MQALKIGMALRTWYEGRTFYQISFGTTNRVRKVTSYSTQCQLKRIGIQVEITVLYYKNGFGGEL